MKGGRGDGVGFGAGGGPWSTQPRTAGVAAGRLGPKTSQPRPATITSAAATKKAFTSPVIAATASARTPAPRGAAGRAGAAGATAASSSARARVIPQWQAAARSGTRRPQLGHDQV